MCFVTVKCPNNHLLNLITDDLARCGLVWHPVGLAQPDHAVPRGNISPSRRPSLPGLTAGRHVVAPWDVDGFHTLPTQAQPQQDSWPSVIPEACPPGEAVVFGQDPVVSDFHRDPARQDAPPSDLGWLGDVSDVSSVVS